MDYRSAWFVMENLFQMWAREAEKHGENPTAFLFSLRKMQFMRKNFIEEGEAK